MKRYFLFVIGSPRFFKSSLMDLGGSSKWFTGHVNLSLLLLLLNRSNNVCLACPQWQPPRVGLAIHAWYAAPFSWNPQTSSSDSGGFSSPKGLLNAIGVIPLLDVLLSSGMGYRRGDAEGSAIPCESTGDSGDLGFRRRRVGEREESLSSSWLRPRLCRFGLCGLVGLRSPAGRYAILQSRGLFCVVQKR